MPGPAPRAGSGGDGASFTCSPGGRLTRWNRAAERLLGIRAADAIGCSCHEVVAGRDLFGNAYCIEECPVRVMARRGVPIRPFRLEVGDGPGRALALRVYVAPVGAARGRPSLIHRLEPIVEDRVARPPAWPERERPRAGRTGRARLSSREMEVLRMIGAGVGTDETALRLGISRTTVRNHIQRCLRKLEAHNRLQAVRIAEGLGILSLPPRH